METDTFGYLITASFFTDVYEFTAAVRGFHFYRKTWRPKKNQILNCYHEKGNVCEQNLRETFGHHPREISRITKYMLDRGAYVSVELTSSHYRRSPLVQGGLEIRCKVTIKTASSFNKAVLERYKEMTKELYIEPKEEEVLGSFFLKESLPPTEHTTSPSRKERPVSSKKRPVTDPKVTPKLKDIRSFFDFFDNSQHVKSDKRTSIMEID